MGKDDSNAAWVQQMQQAQRGRKRRAQDGDTMMRSTDPQFFAPIDGISSGRKSPRTTARISYADVPAVEIEIPEDRLGYEPPSSAPTTAPSPRAIDTGVDAVSALATIAELFKDPVPSSHQ